MERQLIQPGLADVAEHLGTVDVDGTTYWYRGDPPAPLPAIASANLLQILDEYYRGYQHTRALLDIARRQPSGRETSTGMTLIDSQIVGGMTRTIDPERVVFDIPPLQTLTHDDEALIEAAAARYGQFLGRTPTVTVVRRRRRFSVDPDERRTHMVDEGLGRGTRHLRRQEHESIDARFGVVAGHRNRRQPVGYDGDDQGLPGPRGLCPQGGQLIDVAPRRLRGERPSEPAVSTM